MRGTKILATIGPASSTPTQIARLIGAGADGLRLNFSHGTREEHRELLARLHEVIRRVPRPVAIVADLQGPKIRIGDLEAARYPLHEGQTLELDNAPAPGTGTRVGVSLPAVARYVRPGDPLLLGDGTISLKVRRVNGGSIETEVTSAGTLTPHAGLYLPRAKLRANVLGSKDRDDLADALQGGVDYLAVSFVRDAADLRKVRSAMGRRSRSPRAAEPGLIAKIERAEALENIDGILAEADAIMVARGDLGIEVPLERLALEQKQLVRKANIAGKPVVVATQMLLSMVSSPRPTRAEATDVANAVLDGADAVMLSEESAVGQYPAESVEWLARIAEATEPSLDRDRFHAVEASAHGAEQVARSAVELATSVGARAIVTPTHSGRTARWVARHRPGVPIWAFTGSPEVRAQLALVWGVGAYLAPGHQTLSELRRHVLRFAREQGVRSGTVVLTAGYPIEGWPTNLVTLVELGDAATTRGARSRSAAARRRGAAGGARA